MIRYFVYFLEIPEEKSINLIKKPALLDGNQ